MKHRLNRSIFLLMTLSIFSTTVANSEPRRQPQPIANINQNLPQQNAYFNEIYQNGVLRPQYQGIQGFLNDRDRESKTREFLVQSRQAFQGDNALDPIPRILSHNEMSEIQRGVEQRARALRAFLADHYSGAKLYQAARIIPQETLERIVERYDEIGFEGHQNGRDISFIYGPDIIRDAQGSWRVVEDNHGFVGGIGDLPLASRLMHHQYPELARNTSFADPLEFYRRVANSYKERARRHNGIAIMYMSPPYHDNEDERIREIFGAQGIPTVTPDSDLRLDIRFDGVYVNNRATPNAPPVKVGYILLNDEHTSIDSTHAATQRAYLENVAREYVGGIMDDGRTAAHGLLAAILDGRVGCNYSPGTNFVDDKEFYLYVENLIRFYLHEEPILKNIPTFRFSDENTGRIDRDFLRQVSRDKDLYVIKRVDGRGGNAVWVGNKTSNAEFERVLAKVEEKPHRYIAQRYMHLSVLGDNIVDLRPYSAVLPDEIIVSNVPWGRGLPQDGNGKVNVSDQGREITVLVEQNPPSARMCRNIL